MSGCCGGPWVYLWRNIRQNLVFAFIHNVAGVSIAADVSLPSVALAANRGRSHGAVIRQRHPQRPSPSH